MAKKPKGIDGKPVTDGPTTIENIGARADCIRSGFDALLEHDRDIAAAVADHVEPVKKARKKDWDQLATDTGLSKKVLGAHYKLWKQLKDAETFENEGERARVQDEVREIFQALLPGETFDLETYLALGRTAAPREAGGGGGKPSFLAGVETIN